MQINKYTQQVPLVRQIQFFLVALLQGWPYAAHGGYNFAVHGPSLRETIIRFPF